MDTNHVGAWNGVNFGSQVLVQGLWAIFAQNFGLKFNMYMLTVFVSIVTELRAEASKTEDVAAIVGERERERRINPAAVAEASRKLWRRLPAALPAVVATSGALVPAESTVCALMFFLAEFKSASAASAREGGRYHQRDVFVLCNNTLVVQFQRLREDLRSGISTSAVQSVMS